MNRMNNDTFRAQEAPQNAADDEIDLSKIFSIIRRNWHILALGGLVGLLLAIAQLATTTRLYTASVDINIGRSAELDTFQDFSGVAGSRQAEIQIETELLVLRSEQIAERVVRSLSLHQSTQFSASQQTALGRITGFVRRTAATVVGGARDLLSDDLPDMDMLERTRADAETRAIERAISRLRSNMDATSLRGSRVLQVRYTSPSASLSAQIANAIASAYIEDQLEATDEASQRAIDWLLERRDQLRVQLEQVTAIAERFREENDLIGVDIDRLAGAELERLTNDLVVARAEVVQLEARDRRLSEIVMTEDTSAVVRETAGQGITAGLRSRYLEALRSYNSLASSLGDDHAQTQRRMRELEELQELIFEEVRRSAQLVSEDLRAAQERVESLEEAQSRVGRRVGADQAVIMELRDLERNVETVRNFYTNFQQRHQEATQRQEIPVSNARILNRAQSAGGPSSPNAQRVLALGGLLGFLIAGGWVAFREWRDDKVRSEEHVRQELGLEYLGGLTVIKGMASQLRKEQIQTGESAATVPLPEIMTFASDKPLSNYAETLRTGKMSLTLRHGQDPRGAKLGFVSCFPAEGKTTTAANFASLLAQQGAKVILIDGDMRNPGLTRATGRSFEAGLVNVLLGEKEWREVFHQVEGAGVHLLPNSKTRAAHTSELLGGKAMITLLDELDQIYDYVVLDLPPLGPVVDARAILDKLDGVFFMLKWGGTNLEIAKRILRMDPRIRDKCYGAFLNLFDPKKARAYGDYQGYGYYRSYYNRYYRDS